MAKVFSRKLSRVLLALVMAITIVSPLATPARAESPRAPQYALDDNLGAYWRLDEANGARNDFIGLSHLASANDVGQAAGKNNYAGQFTAANSQSLSVADNAMLSSGDIDFTVSAWVYLDSKGSNRSIVQKLDSGVYEYSLYYDSGADRFGFAVSATGAPTGGSLHTLYANNAGSPSLSTWYYVVGWHDSVNDTINIQINGGTVDSVAHSTGVVDSNATFYIGRNGNGNFWDGRIDSVGFWKRVLTSDERTSLYNSGAGCDYPFCTTSYGAIEVWNIGNYLKDGNMEESTVWDNTPWGAWGSGPAFAHSLQNSWTNGGVTPLCGSWFRQYSTSDTGAISDGFGNVIQISSQPFGSLNQKFMWYGGDMYIVFAYMNESGVDINVKLTDPFGQTTTIETVSNTAAQWKVYYEKISDQILGRYSLAIEPTSATFGQDVAIDCVSIGEGWYQPFTYNSTPLTPPPDITGVLTRKDPGTFVDASGNLIPNPQFTESGGVLPYWFTVSGFVKNVNNGDGTGYIKIGANTGNKNLVMTKSWIQTLYELPPKKPDGYADNFTSTLLKQIIYISFVTDLQRDLIEQQRSKFAKILNVETGEIFDLTYVQNTVLPPTSFGQSLSKPLYKFDLPPGKYRMIFTTDAEATKYRNVVYLNKVCVSSQGSYQDTFLLADCEMSALDFVRYTLDGDFQDQQAWGAQATAMAQSTATAQYGTAYALATQSQATSQARAYATQTALVASGNTTRIAQATQAQGLALTATPAAAATGTSFVQGFNATNTAIAATQNAKYQNVNTQYAVQTQAQALNNAQATANAKIQATVGAPATAVALLTSQPAAQATLVQQQTQQVAAQPTVNWYSTQFVATQNAAATAYAQSANATTSYQATQSVRVVQTSNAVVTQQANLQATTIALSNAQATIVAQGQTNATTVAQIYPTVQLTLQAQATQQVLAQPPTQPDPGWQASCSIPDNPLNLAWWIDYEVCRVLSWFSWSPVNTAQISSVQTGFLDREPFGTIKELQDGYIALQTTLDQYDWSGTGVGNGGVCEGQGLLPGYNFNMADCFIGYIARLDPSSGIFSGNFTLTPSNNTVYSTQCDTNMNTVLGPYSTQAMCFIYNTVRELGFMMWIQLAFDVGLGFLFWKYLQRAWISKATSG